MVSTNHTEPPEAAMVSETKHKRTVGAKPAKSRVSSQAEFDSFNWMRGVFGDRAIPIFLSSLLRSAGICGVCSCAPARSDAARQGPTAAGDVDGDLLVICLRADMGALPPDVFHELMAMREEWVSPSTKCYGTRRCSGPTKRRSSF